MKNMSHYRSNVWRTLLKVLLLVFGLYLAYIVLIPLLGFLLGIGYWMMKILIYLAAGLFVFHLLLKLLFGVNFSEIIFGPDWRNRF
ncbi:hypothetical protein Sgly_2078 [Syntrophobotulus glycolicus DSM 8271]|uniref:Uncharacterized protein n=1 Tax=Syntrophobotulus glycolicus (strain DSM 8271 / FlGlyR) TaxID=645991 RepID=F0T227_SYNGF|nr:hypothetical protein [Syntrophobotulus glycolicus]ADY56371.1 hypothetical protein Sgly_2078 [Syntrophobotulus glycolicus DSM 8271]